MVAPGPPSTPVPPGRHPTAAPFIRAASATDIVDIADFQTECWREAYAGLVPPDYLRRVTVADRTRRWAERLRAGTRLIALAEQQGRVVGVVSWGRGTGAADGPALELKSLYVAAAHRSLGLGRALAEWAIGSEPAHLWVFAANDRAMRFYASIGFAADGGRTTDADTGLAEVRLVRGAMATPARLQPRQVGRFG